MAVAAYLSPYWVEVLGFSPKARLVYFRRIHETKVRRMGRIAFKRKARPA